MPEGILRAPVLNATAEQGAHVQVVPQGSDVTAAIVYMKVKAITARNVRDDIMDLEKFTGETGELNHFIKGSDRIMAKIKKKMEEDLLTPGDAEELSAVLVCRVKRKILNQIQADEGTPWEVVKARLKKEFGRGRWTPEEDIFYMFRETKKNRQTNGQYAEVLLDKYNKITEKMRETATVVEVEARMAFLSTILKVQLARETGRKENFPSDRTFLECANEMADMSAREEETRGGEEEFGWKRVSYKRSEPKTWRIRTREREIRDVRPPTPRREVRSIRRGERDQTGRRFDRNGVERRKCFECGRTGHLAAACDRIRCFECRSTGHVARDCPFIYRRKDRGEPMEIGHIRRRKIKEGRNSTSGSSRSSSTEVMSSDLESEGECRPTRWSEIIKRKKKKTPTVNKENKDTEANY